MHICCYQVWSLADNKYANNLNMMLQSQNPKNIEQTFYTDILCCLSQDLLEAAK